jgi:hypothetical protein
VTKNRRTSVHHHQLEKNLDALRALDCGFSCRLETPNITTLSLRGPSRPFPNGTTGTMVKSHVDCSPDLTWALVQSQNVFVRRSRSATRQKTFRSFSAEKNNLTSLHSFKHSGACANRASTASRASVSRARERPGTVGVDARASRGVAARLLRLARRPVPRRSHRHREKP